MADGISVRIKNLPQLRAALMALPKKAGMIATTRGLRVGAEMIKQEVDKEVPVGETGNLAQGIKIRAGRSGMSEYSFYIRSTAPHSWLVEHGHRWILKNRKGGRVVASGTVPPNAFMRRSFDGKADSAADAICQRIGEEVKKVWEKMKI